MCFYKSKAVIKRLWSERGCERGFYPCILGLRPCPVTDNLSCSADAALLEKLERIDGESSKYDIRFVAIEDNEEVIPALNCTAYLIKGFLPLQYTFAKLLCISVCRQLSMGWTPCLLSSTSKTGICLVHGNVYICSILLFHCGCNWNF